MFIIVGTMGELAARIWGHKEAGVPVMSKFFKVRVMARRGVTLKSSLGAVYWTGAKVSPLGNIGLLFLYKPYERA